MFRRALQTPASKLAVAARPYTDYQHFKYPICGAIAYGIPAYFLFFWFIWVRMGTVFTKRNEYKKDYFRVWRRKLGSGYGWSEDFGPQKETLFKNLPSSVE